MFHIYQEYDLNSAQNLLAQMFDKLINSYELDANEAALFFVISGFAKKIEDGDSFVINGMSGSELADQVYAICRPYMVRELAEKYGEGRSPEYWAGMYLAAYQWESTHPFEEIFARIPFVEIVEMYRPYHEMDQSHFNEEMERRYALGFKDSKLKKMRESAGLTQEGLAQRADVNIRSIQMFEQGVNDINKAQAATLFKLSKALFCSIEDLLER